MSDQVPVKKRFSKKLKTMIVEIEEDDGQVREYTLCEISGPQRDAFLALREKFIEGDKLKEGAISAIAAKLLSMSLRDPEGKMMSEMEALNLPAETQQDLFTESIKLSGMDKKANESAKND